MKSLLLVLFFHSYSYAAECDSGALVSYSNALHRMVLKLQQCHSALSDSYFRATFPTKNAISPNSDFTKDEAIARVSRMNAEYISGLKADSACLDEVKKLAMKGQEIEKVHPECFGN